MRETKKECKKKKKKRKGVHPFLKYPPRIRPEDQHLRFSLISFQTESILIQ